MISLLGPMYTSHGQKTVIFEVLADFIRLDHETLTVYC